MRDHFVDEKEEFRAKYPIQSLLVHDRSGSPNVKDTRVARRRPRGRQISVHGHSGGHLVEPKPADAHEGQEPIYVVLVPEV